MYVYVQIWWEIKEIVIIIKECISPKHVSYMQVYRLNLESAKLARQAADEVTAATGMFQLPRPQKYLPWLSVIRSVA